MTTLALPEPPASGIAPPARRRPLLAQCLVLAGLLHLLVVLVFGNTPGGSARPGEGLWGAFQVRLVGPGPAAQPDALGAETRHTGPAGLAERQRFGGAVRPEAEPRPSDSPGAAQAGRWLPQAAEGDAQAPPLAMTADPNAPAVPPMAVVDLPARQSVDTARPLPAEAANVSAAAVTAGPAPTAALQAPPLPGFEVQNAPAPRSVAPRQAVRALAPPALVDGAPVAPPSVPSFAAEPPPRARQVTPRPVATALAAPATPDLPPLAAPALPHFATDAPPPARALAPRATEPSLAPLASSDLPAPPAPMPALPSFPLQAAPPPRPLAQRERASAVNALAPADLPAAPANAPPLPSFATQPAANPRAVAARPAPPSLAPPAAADLTPAAPDRPVLPSFAVAPGAAAPGAAAVSAAGNAAPAVAGPSQAPAPALAAVPASPLGVKQVAGAPDAGASVGHDLATAPTQPAPAARLNLELARPRGGPIAAQGSRGLLSVVPHPPELKTKLEKEIELSGLADCRKAYSAMGLAAVAPLGADALREKGCRW